MAYILGHSGAELDRLSTQATLLRPITARLLRAAGVGSGDRVLDLGTGAGDVAMLAAGLVGPGGSVTGIDRSADAIHTARRRTNAAGITTIDYVQADLDTYDGPAGFDAVTSRLVMLHQADPVAYLRRAARLVRPGGVLAVHEMDIYRCLHAAPRVPLIEEIWEWLLTMSRDQLPSGDVGSRLAGVFLAAALPNPVMFAETVVEAPGTWAICSWLAELLGSQLSALVSRGIVTAERAALDTVGTRLRDAVAQAGAQVELVPQTCAWVRLPESA